MNDLKVWYNNRKSTNKNSEVKLAKAQSIEPNIADSINGWLKDYGLDYK